MNRFDKEWINSIPKDINENGCWVSYYEPDGNGYVRVNIAGSRYLLHRVSMCLWHEIDYHNSKVEARHSKGCDTRCFNPEHIKPGTMIENKKDRVEHHRDEVCKVCGSSYYYRRTIRDGIPRTERRCKKCHLDNQRKRRLSGA